jgi:hypothetical protein
LTDFRHICYYIFCNPLNLLLKLIRFAFSDELCLPQSLSLSLSLSLYNSQACARIQRHTGTFILLHVLVLWWTWFNNI